MDSPKLTTSASEASQVVGPQGPHDLTPDLVRQMRHRERARASFLCLLVQNNDILFATPALPGCGSLFVSVLGAPLPPRPADAAKQSEESFEGALKRPPNHHACRLPRALPPASDQASLSFAPSAFRFLDRSRGSHAFEGRKLLQHGFSTQTQQKSKLDRNKLVGERFSRKNQSSRSEAGGG